MCVTQGIELKASWILLQIVLKLFRTRFY